MTIFTHKDNGATKNYGAIQREFNRLRRDDDEFARDYRGTELDRYIMDNYTTPEIEIETNSEEEIGAIISNETFRKWKSLVMYNWTTLTDAEIEQIAIEENLVSMSTGNETINAFVKGFRSALKKILQHD